MFPRNHQYFLLLKGPLKIKEYNYCRTINTMFNLFLITANKIDVITHQSVKIALST